MRKQQEIKIERIEEFQIHSTLRQAISNLLKDSFQGYPNDRIFYKQLPAFRFLAWSNGNLIGHLGIEHRIINNAGQLLNIFGIVDLCVHLAHQHQKIATRLLKKVENLATSNHIDFLLLNASEHNLYESNGFACVQAKCRWLLINKHQTLGVADRTLKQTIMIKRLGNKEWQNGPLDF